MSININKHSLSKQILSVLRSHFLNIEVSNFQLFYIYKCSAYMYVYVALECLVPEEVWSGWWRPWIWSYTWVWVISMWRLSRSLPQQPQVLLPADSSLQHSGWIFNIWMEPQAKTFETVLSRPWTRISMHAPGLFIIFPICGNFQSHS